MIYEFKRICCIFNKKLGDNSTNSQKGLPEENSELYFFDFPRISNKTTRQIFRIIVLTKIWYSCCEKPDCFSFSPEQRFCKTT